MQIKCKYCGKPIITDHYFITKHGSICVNCKNSIAKDIRSFGRVDKNNSDNNGNNPISVADVG